MTKHSRGSSWSNANHPVAPAFAYAVPPPASYEEYEFSGRLIYKNRLIDMRNLIIYVIFIENIVKIFMFFQKKKSFSLMMTIVYIVRSEMDALQYSKMVNQKVVQ